MRRIAFLPLLLLLVLAAPASAVVTQTETGAVQDAVDAFRGGDSVYVHPDAREALPRSQEEGLEEQIGAAGGGIFLAVYPEEAGPAESLGTRIVEGTGEPGTYGIVSGTRFVAGSDEFRNGVAARLANDAANSGSTASQVLSTFVSSVEQARSGGGGARGGGESGGTGFLVLLGALAAAIGFVKFRGSRRRKRVEERQLADLRRVANDDLLALGGDIRAHDLDIEMPGVSPETRQRYAEAVEAYTRAEEALDRASKPEDFEPIGKELEEGRYDIAAAAALLRGEPAPERWAPCFFDPRHGPSVTDMEWAPAGGEPRPVPVCAADAARLEDGYEPMSREIVLDGQRMPYWQAPGQFAPFYAAGMFGGFGGLATGMLFGSMLGGGWGAGDAWAGGGGFGGGDFGGGGFGGGDFGGGGFGGGDFG